MIIIRKVLGSRVLGRWLGNEEGTFTNGVNTFIRGSGEKKKALERPLALSAMWEQKK